MQFAEPFALTAPLFVGELQLRDGLVQSVDGRRSLVICIYDNVSAENICGRDSDAHTRVIYSEVHEGIGRGQ